MTSIKTIHAANHYISESPSSGPNILPNIARKLTIRYRAIDQKFWTAIIINGPTELIGCITMVHLNVLDPILKGTNPVQSISPLEIEANFIWKKPNGRLQLCYA